PAPHRLTGPGRPLGHHLQPAFAGRAGRPGATGPRSPHQPAPARRERAVMATPTTMPGWILRIGSSAGLPGALLGLAPNLLHPATPIGDSEAVARTIADSRLWVPDHLAIVLGLILMLGGLVAMPHSIQDGLPAALAQLGAR